MANNQEILAQLRRDLSRSAQRTFDLYRQENPAEDFYAFGLSSDSGCYSGASPAANSEQAFERAVKKQVPDVYAPEEIGFLRYCPDNWAYSGAGSTDGWIEIWDMHNQIIWDNDDSDARDELRDQILKTMTLALRDLDSEGYFGSGFVREKITLLIWKFDSFGAAVDILDWVRDLNPPNVYKRFESEWPLPD